MLTYALSVGTGRMVCIDNVEGGLSCNCCCPKCKEPLIAKKGNGGRQSHFAHKSGSDCHGSYMTALHRMAEQIIQEEKSVMAPAYKDVYEQKLHFNSVEVEQRVERKDIQPDIVGEAENGKRWFIEIRNTHEVDEKKKAKLIESGITCLEIDVREQTLEELRTFLLESAENRKWIVNTNYESLIADIRRKKVIAAEKLLKDKAILIPGYRDYGSKEIKLRDFSVLYKSADGQYSRVKAFCSARIPYIFNIISKETLENSTTTLIQEKECNELTIFTDNWLLDATDIQSNIEWTFHLASAKELERKLRDSKYEILPEAYCRSHCKHRPSDGMCIYMRERIQKEGGDDDIVCNKEKRLKEEMLQESNEQKGDAICYQWRHPCGYAFPPVQLEFQFEDDKPQEARR